MPYGELMRLLHELIKETSQDREERSMDGYDNISSYRMCERADTTVELAAGALRSALMMQHRIHLPSDASRVS